MQNWMGEERSAHSATEPCEQNFSREKLKKTETETKTAYVGK